MGNSLEQWRAAIGSFRRSKFSSGATYDDDVNCYDDGCAMSSPAGCIIHIGWKTAVFSLLMMGIAALCHADLLLRSGVESNPGPKLIEDSRDVRETILAGLCAKAADPEVRDILRQYSLDAKLARKKSHPSFRKLEITRTSLSKA